MQEIKAAGFNHKHLLGIAQLSREDIYFILDTATSMKEISRRRIKKIPTLRGLTIVNYFAEPSTRTRISFEIAEKRMSADAINVSVSTSSAVKGETLLDTIRNIQAMKCDAIVIRHGASGVPHMLAKKTTASVINAGDGIHEHPTQALLDAFTIREVKGRLEGLNVLICGDILHSRVARSDCFLLKKVGAEVTVFGPMSMIPADVEHAYGVKVARGRLRDIIKDVDVVIMLRIQRERQLEAFYPSDREYSKYFGLTSEVVAEAKDELLIMHPGPVNRGVEISPEIADSGRSVILDQVENGVAVRMAVLFLICGATIQQEQQNSLRM